MNPLMAWRRPVAMLEQAAGLGALGWLWYWWLGIAESSTARLLLSLAVMAALLAGLWFLARRGRQRLDGAGGGGPAAVAALLLAMSLVAGYQLIWWVPEVKGLQAQTASVAVRFGLAFLLLLTFWANLLAAWPSGGRAAADRTAETAGQAG